MMNNINAKWTFLFCVLFIGSLFCSCGEKDSKKPGPGPDATVALEVNTTELGFKQEGGQDVVIVTSNSKWTVVPSVNWCQLSKMAGVGNDTLRVVVDQNPSTSTRQGQIILSAGGQNKKTVTVVQFGVTPSVMMFVGGKEIPGLHGVVDIEHARYNLTLLANFPFDVTRLGDEDYFAWTVDNTTTTSSYDYKKAYKFSFADYTGDQSRFVSLLVKEINGQNTDTVKLEQPRFKDFVRLWEDTVYAGSHYSLVEIPCRSTIAWTYEFVDGTPSWLSNPRTKNADGPVPHFLGQNGSLIFDIEKNTSTVEKRICQIRFKYTLDGKNEEKVVKVVQFPKNSITSDSLVLMDIASRNTHPDAGLNLGWIEGKPVTSWANLKWGVVNGETRLLDLNMNDGWLVYELTPSVGNLDQLTGLNISKNFLEGELPKEIGRLTKLKNLQCNDNYNTDMDMTPAARPSGLTGIPKELFENCRDLESLVLSTNLFESIPEEIGNLTKLRNLEISGLYTLKTLPLEAFKKLRSLTSFYITGLKGYEGEFPAVVFDMPWLTEITIMSVKMPDGTVLPDKFDQLPNLRALVIFDANISGTLPKSIARCPKLNMVQFGKNKLTGTLPEEYGQMDSLRALAMEENLLEGTIPASWANLCNYYYRSGETSIGLFLNNNQLSGEIPAAMKSSPVWGNGYDEDNNKIGNWEPEKYICPQKPGFSFTNCK